MKKCHWAKPLPWFCTSVLYCDLRPSTVFYCIVLYVVTRKHTAGLTTHWYTNCIIIFFYSILSSQPEHSWVCKILVRQTHTHTHCLGDDVPFKSLHTLSTRWLEHWATCNKCHGLNFLDDHFISFSHCFFAIEYCTIFPIMLKYHCQAHNFNQILSVRPQRDWKPNCYGQLTPYNYNTIIFVLNDTDTMNKGLTICNHW